MRRAFEQDVGRILTLGGDPVVGHGFQKICREWINLFGVTVKPPQPIQRTKAIREFLSSGQSLDPKKRVLGITDCVLLQFPGEPLMSVDLNLDLERKRRLQPDMHQAEIQMNKTEVEEPTLATRRSDERFPFFTPE